MAQVPVGMADRVSSAIPWGSDHTEIPLTDASITVSQVATLVKASNGGIDVTSAPNAPEFRLVLQRHRIGRSNRVTRLFGSRRLIQVSVSPVFLQKASSALWEFFTHKFVLNGRIFEAIYVKDGTVYLLETADYHAPGSRPPARSGLSNRGRVTVAEFITWHNPPKFNSAQVSWTPLTDAFDTNDLMLCRLSRNGQLDSPSRSRHLFRRAASYRRTYARLKTFSRQRCAMIGKS